MPLLTGNVISTLSQSNVSVECQRLHQQSTRRVLEGWPPIDLLFTMLRLFFLFCETDNCQDTFLHRSNFSICIFCLPQATVRERGLMSEYKAARNTALQTSVALEQQQRPSRKSNTLRAKDQPQTRGNFHQHTMLSHCLVL
jgi:hypothetical protein